MQNIGYPRICPMFTLTARSPAFAAGYIPADVIDIELAVRQVEPPERRLVVLKYQWSMTLSEIGALLDETKWVARRKIEGAEASVHSAYCALGTKSVKVDIVKERVANTPALSPA